MTNQINCMNLSCFLCVFLIFCGSIIVSIEAGRIVGWNERPEHATLAIFHFFQLGVWIRMYIFLKRTINFKLFTTNSHANPSRKKSTTTYSLPTNERNSLNTLKHAQRWQMDIWTELARFTLLRSKSSRYVPFEYKKSSHLNTTLLLCHRLQSSSSNNNRAKQKIWLKWYLLAAMAYFWLLFAL